MFESENCSKIGCFLEASAAHTATPACLMPPNIGEVAELAFIVSRGDFGGLLSGRHMSLAFDGSIASYGHTIVAPTRLMQAALHWPLLGFVRRSARERGLRVTRRMRPRDGWRFVGGLRSRTGGEA
jgi:hypothetical protein